MQKDFCNYRDIADSFEFIDGNWKEVHRIDKYIFGNEIWQKSSVAQNGYYTTVLDKKYKLTDNGVISDLICNAMNVTSGVNVFNANQDSIATFTSQTYDYIRINVTDASINTVEKVKQAMNKVELYYIRSEAEYLDCTEQQIQELEAISKAVSYKNITNITCKDEIKCNFHVEYYQDVELLLNDIKDATMLSNKATRNKYTYNR